MTKEEAIKQLKDIQLNGGDQELDHGQADDILCSLLISLGFPEVVEEWDKIDKWYA